MFRPSPRTERVILNHRSRCGNRASSPVENQAQYASSKWINNGYQFLFYLLVYALHQDYNLMLSQYIQSYFWSALSYVSIRDSMNYHQSQIILIDVLAQFLSLFLIEFAFNFSHSIYLTQPNYKTVWKAFIVFSDLEAKFKNKICILPNWIVTIVRKYEHSILVSDEPSVSWTRSSKTPNYMHTSISPI